jgi:hypothetical protein
MELGDDVHRWPHQMSRLKISETVSPHPSCAEVRLYCYYHSYYYYYWIMIFDRLFSNCAVCMYVCMYLCIFYSTVCSATGYLFHKWNWSEQSYLQYSLRQKFTSQFSVLTITMLLMLLCCYAVIFKRDFYYNFSVYLVYFSYVTLLSLLLALRLLCQHIKNKELLSSSS